MDHNLNESQLPTDFSLKKIGEAERLIRSGTSFTVVGMASMGISSYLKYLACQDFGTMLHIDINQLPEMTVEQFWKLVARQLGISNLNQETASLIVECQAKTKQLLSQTNKVVFIFNRFDRLANLFSVEIFANLRVIRDLDRQKIVMVFSANQPIPSQAEPSIMSGNLNLFSQLLHLTPYSQLDLRALVELYSPELLLRQNTDQALRISSGHYLLAQILLKSDHVTGNPLLDPNVKMVLAEIMRPLTPQQQSQLRMLAKGHTVPEIDPFLVDIGLVFQTTSAEWKFFTPLLQLYLATETKTYTKHRLPMREKKLYNLLKSKTGQIIAKETIFSQVWGDEDPDATDWALNALIYRLRRHPVFKGKGFEIESIKKQGYRLTRI